MKTLKAIIKKTVRPLSCCCFGMSILLTSVMPLSPLYAASTLNSIDIVTNTLKGVSDCMHYKVVGLCFWRRCHGMFCHVETTLKVDQYLPDAVVSVYTHKNNNPWDYARQLVDPIFNKAGQLQMRQFTGFGLGDGGAENDNSQRDINNKFHDVDIIGNPALLILSGYKIMLPSAATPYVPYYSSLLDAYAWRFPALEQFYPSSYIPGLHDVGMIGLHDWGTVYPRNGYVNQPDDAKAGAVAALRASTIITSTLQPHIYKSLANTCGTHCHSYPVKENDANAQYQMIYPKAESQCTVFGGSDVTQLQPWESDGASKGHNRYAWVLWRHYHGCIPDHGATYLGSISF